LAILLAGISFPNFDSQAQAVKQIESVRVLDSISSTSLILRKKYENKNKPVVAKLDEIMSLILTLKRVANTQQDNLSPKVYLESLEADNQLLTSIIEGRVNSKNLMSVISAVASDLTLKVTYVKASRGSSFELVEVVVHTLKNTRDEVGGYEIWYVPKGWAAYPEAQKQRRFDRLSSPSVMKLAPGNFLIWAVKGDSYSGRVPITLGDDGMSKRVIDLTVK
jgi:hypothetical protein